MKTILLFLCFSISGLAQFGNATSIWGKPICSASPTASGPLTWDAAQGCYTSNPSGLAIGTTVLDPTTGIKGPLIACVGAPGNTAGPYGSLCEVRATGALWGCTNAAGCTVSGDWAAAGGAASLPSVVISTSSPVTVGSVATWYWNNSAGAMTFTLPTITSGLVGLQLCFRNSVTRTGAVTLQAPASTSIDVNGANGTAAGTAVSGGALGDSACVVAISTTQYAGYILGGVWVNN